MTRVFSGLRNIGEGYVQEHGYSVISLENPPYHGLQLVKAASLAGSWAETLLRYLGPVLSASSCSQHPQPWRGVLVTLRLGFLGTWSLYACWVSDAPTLSCRECFYSEATLIQGGINLGPGEITGGHVVGLSWVRHFICFQWPELVSTLSSCPRPTFKNKPTYYSF